MKKHILFILLLISNFSFAQDSWFVKDPNGFDFYLTTTIKNGIITGQTRKNALKDIVGGFKFALAKVGTSVKYPEIVHFRGSLLNHSFNGTYQMIFSRQNCNGTIANDSIRILLTGKNRNTSELIGMSVDSITPVRDYKKTFEKIFEVTESNIYNQSFIKSNKWFLFKTRMLKLSEKINDDLELQIAFSAIARDFPFSHYYLYHKVPEGKTNNLRDSFAELKEMNANTILLKVKSFSGSKQEMDSLITIIDNGNYQNLIIDLRNNPGGNHISAFPLVEYLIDKPITAGVFPNMNWYREYNRLPTKNDYPKFSEFTGGSFEEWFDKAQQKYGVYFKVLPSQNHFEGNVYILTNNRTASTCEPIVYGLKYHKYATIIGEHTAGAMLSSSEFEIEDDIILRIPLNDYVTYSGNRIDKVGVEPTIKVKSGNALTYTLELITTGYNLKPLK